MQLECFLEKFKTAISNAEKITGKNLSLPDLKNILIKAENNSLNIKSTNLNLGLDIDLPAKVKKTGTVSVNGSVLNNVLSGLDGDKIFLQQEGNNLKIQAGNVDLEIKTYPFEDFPIIPKVVGNTFQINAKKFCSGLRSVWYSSSTSDIKPELSSVYIYPQDQELFFVATDSFRLAEKKIKIKKYEEFNGILLPAKNVSDIVRIFGEVDEEIKIVFSDNQISFAFEGVYLTSRILDGVFPDYNQIMPKSENVSVIVLKQDLINALKVSNVFSGRFQQINLTVDLKEKALKINSEDSDVGRNQVALDASISNQTDEDINVSFNNKYITDCFQSINSDSLILSFQNSTKPMTIKGVGDKTFTYLVMPMNK